MSVKEAPGPIGTGTWRVKSENQNAVTTHKILETILNDYIFKII